MDALKQAIKAEAEKLGFCFCGFTDCSPLDDFPRYQKWISEVHYGTMSFLCREDHINKRKNPRLIFSEAKSICVLGVPYNLQNDPALASYAFYKDYHDQIPRQIERLIKNVETQCEVSIQRKISVDSAPLLERSIAVRAGVGWIGKSSMLIHPQFGSAFLLAECLIDQEVEPDTPFTKDLCGSCERCIKNCPTHCIDPVNRTIRANECISYLTIEHKGEFSQEQQASARISVFGCDRCLSVCPWNLRRGNIETFLETQSNVPGLADLGISDEIFREKFAGSAFYRTKNKGIQRNLENFLREKAFQD